MQNSPATVVARWIPAVNGHLEGVGGIEKKEGIEEAMRRKSPINAGMRKSYTKCPFAYER